MPCPGPFHFSYSVDYIYDFCPLPDPDVGLSIFVCDVEHTSFHFGLRGRKFVLCLFGQCPGFCTICESSLKFYLVSKPVIVLEQTKTNAMEGFIGTIAVGGRGIP